MHLDRHRALRKALATIQPETLVEADDLALVERLAANGDPWSRDSPVHVTGSALIVDPPSRRVLLRWHPRQQAWLQVGGHADPGERDPFDVARREAAEETGLSDLRSWPDPVPRVLHLVVVPVPAANGEPAHEHADVRYLVATERPDDARAESDHAPLRWLSLDDGIALTTEANLRDTLGRARCVLGW